MSYDIPPTNVEPTGAWPMVSVVIVNWNGLAHLQRAIPAVLAQDYPNCELIVVDNASRDDSVAWIRTNHPAVKVITSEQNLGYAAGNNLGFTHATGEVIAPLNPDTEVDSQWLKELIQGLRNYPHAGLAAPKIVHWDRPETINACGNQITFTGLTFCRGLDEPSTHYSEPELISAISGAAFVIRKEVIEAIGGFDESFFLYYEDTDLSLRATLAGYDIVYIPTAIVRHCYRFKFSSQKCFYQERNRYRSLIKNLRWPTLVALFPALLLSEVIAWGYLLLKQPAAMGGKLHSYGSLVAGLPRLIRDRRQVQKLRRRTDREILSRFGWKMTLAQTAGSWLTITAERILSPLVYLCGMLAKLVVWW